MSRRPGIAKGWLDQFLDDVYPKDFITINGKKVRPPKYYDNVLETTRPYEFEEIKSRRIQKIGEVDDWHKHSRVRAKERLAELRLSRLLRNHDKE